MKYALLAFSLLSLYTAAGVVTPGDGPYFSYIQTDIHAEATGGTQYIFEAHSQKFIHELAAYNSAIREIYQKSFAWQLDEREDLVLTSPSQQIANAYATVIPNLKTVWFPSGVLMLEEMAQSSWLLALTTHETAHLYQLNAKGSVNSALKRVFRNTPVTVFFGIPLFIHPNILAPTFLLEGNATWNESRFNLGGRLHSGEKRALVFAQIREGEVDPNRLMNMQLKFPYGEEAYLLGGYFFAHLAKKHGVDKANQFFAAQGEHYINPFIVNRTFRKHFGSSYPQEIREFVRTLEIPAMAQKRSESLPLLSGVAVGTLNYDANSLWVLMTNGVEPTELVRFNKQEKTLTRTPIDLPMGKVFYNENRQPESAASLPHNLHKIEYSLYGEGLRLNEKYRGQIVTDQRAGKTVALDAANSWLEGQLLVNGTFYDIAHSSAIIDESGSLYYFRQNGFERVLYKNREPLMKYQGYYGKPIAVGSKGEVYFIANTDFGSSLFKYKNHELTRVLASDTIVDAGLINDSEFLVLEVGTKGYDLKVVKATTTAQAPAVYEYGYPTQSLIPQKSLTAEQVRSEQSTYNSLTHLRLSSADFKLGYGNFKGLYGNTQFSFTDPLEWSNLHLQFHKDDLKTNYTLSYEYSRYLIDILAAYEFSEKTRTINSNEFGLAIGHEVLLGLGVPLLKHRRWNSSLALYANHRNNEFDTVVTGSIVEGLWREKYGLLSIFDLHYDHRVGVAMFPWRNFQLQYKNDLNSELKAWTKSENSSILDVQYTHGLPQEFFARGIATAAWAEGKDIDVSHVASSSLSAMTVDRLAGREIFKEKNVQRARLEVQKVINLSSYSPRVPIGIRRIAPVVTGQVIALNKDRHRTGYPSTIYEYGYGADLELLLLHKVPVLQRTLFGEDNLRKETTWTSTLNWTHQF